MTSSLRNDTQKSSERFYRFVCFVCLFTNLSQLPALVELSWTRYVSIPIWVILALIVIGKTHRLTVKGADILYLLFIYILIFNAAQALLLGSSSSVLYDITLAMFVLTVGIQTGLTLDKKYLSQINTVYVLSALIVCVNVFFSYVYGHSLSGLTYVYASKNSVSQILLTAWTIILLYKLNDGTLAKKIFYWLSFAFLTVTMISLKSRATLIGIPVIVLCILFADPMSTRKRWVLVLAVIAVAVVLNNNNLYRTLVDDFLLAGRDSTDLNAISSGRVDEWGDFFSDIAGAELFGLGRAKRESLILTALLEGGILGGIPILLIAVWPVKWSFKYHRVSRDTDSLLLLLLAVVYATNGIFEQLAPFGPGVKCYYLWFLLGIMISWANKDAERIKQEKGMQRLKRSL